MNFDDRGVIIPDISFYQDDPNTPQKVDFARMKLAGAVGVILGGGQNSWIDQDFNDYVIVAEAAGLPWGSYWFFDSRLDANTQAEKWKSALAGRVPKLGLWVDLEESYDGPYKGEKSWRNFVEAVKARMPGVKIGIYTANWWWSRQT